MQTHGMTADLTFEST